MTIPFFLAIKSIISNHFLQILNQKHVSCLIHTIPIGVKTFSQSWFENWKKFLYNCRKERTGT